MALSIKNHRVEEIARKIAEQTGESLTEAIHKALNERLARLAGRRRLVGLADQLDDIAKRCASLPTLDNRREDDILGYDEHGLPH